MTDYLYHVTLGSSLESIAEHGLQPGGASNFGGGYQAHSQGKVFFCEAEGVGCWWQKIADLCFHHHEPEDVADLFHVPVVLRTPEADLICIVDEIGSQDCPGESVYVEEEFPADELEVWDGEKWQKLGEVSAEDVVSAYIAKDKAVSDEDGEWRDVELELPDGWDSE